MSHELISTNSTWERIAGFSRAVRVGAMVCVSGTTASDEFGRTTCPNDAHGQAVYILRHIEGVLAEAGAQLADVVRTRIYIVDYDDWEAVARAHGEVFKDMRPANSLVVVRALVPDDALVEIEVDAIISHD